MQRLQARRERDVAEDSETVVREVERVVRPLVRREVLDDRDGQPAQIKLTLVQGIQVGGRLGDELGLGEIHPRLPLE